MVSKDKRRIMISIPDYLDDSLNKIVETGKSKWMKVTKSSIITTALMTFLGVIYESVKTTNSKKEEK